ncbi:hypothetical protein E1B28_005280 [Marasmius oreades]|uniref:Aldehyde dehydrogenase domain-containing protein n=1 Tax=Marasmius oreades TaxID=181124 RepID=A0A9P7V0I5_9AGAR|nr:uncharacterized protein E1B28_005280 [Marasmius oreades]KAG7097970.1 hypothetical protein E1B28_005280 [Marasmius oreades]
MNPTESWVKSFPGTRPLYLMVAFKIAPALSTGNVCVLKPSEIAPLTSQKMASLINEAGFPPGVVNIINGYGHTVGAAISSHPKIAKIAFTGSTLTGRKIQEASARSNLKVVSLELGGKSPNIIFEDADFEQAVKWAVVGIYTSAGQSCMAGSRIFVQESIYDKFVEAFRKAAEARKTYTGNPFDQATQQGPQVSQIQFDRVMSYIDSAKTEGATISTGGQRHGNEGFFIQPTIITDCKPEMKVVREEIFGPVAVVIKFKTEEGKYLLTVYLNAGGVFTENNSRAVRVSHALQGGSIFVNCYGSIDPSLPFGGYKQSGIGREMGEYALETYTQVKAVHVNLSLKI